MKGVFRAALRNELTKFARQKFPYLGLLAVVFLVAVFCLRGILMAAGPGVEFNGFFVVVKGAMAALTSVIPLFAVIFASAMVASETASGTYRNVLSRPIGRVEFLTAKIVFAFAYAVLLVVFSIIAAVAASIGRYPFGPITDSGEVIYSAGRMAVTLVVACLVSLAPLFAVVCYGILVSTAAKSLTSALGIGVGLLIAIEPVKHYIRWGEWQFSDYVVTSYLDTGLGIAGQAAAGFDYQWFPGGWWGSELGRGLTLSFAAAAIFLAASYAIFLRRDLNFS